MREGLTKYALALLLSASFAVGCEAPGEATAEKRSQRSALADGASITIEEIAASQREGEGLLGVGARGELLFGAPVEALPNTDQPPLFRPRLHSPGNAKAASLPDDLGVIEGATFLPEGALLLLTEDHRLLAWDGKSLELVDEGVHGPVARSPSGQFIAYLEGEEPVFSIVSRDMKANTMARPAGDITGCWSPAVGDGGEVVFMASATGYGELYRAVPGEDPVKLTERERGQTIAVPSGPSAPLLLDGSLYFEDRDGAHRIDLSGDAKGITSASLAPGIRDLVWTSDRERAIGRSPDGALSVVSLEGQGGAR